MIEWLVIVLGLVQGGFGDPNTDAYVIGAAVAFAFAVAAATVAARS